MTTPSLQRLMIAFLLVCAVGVAGRADSAGAASAADPSHQASPGVSGATDDSPDDVDAGDSSRSDNRFDRLNRTKWGRHRAWDGHQNSNLVSIGHDSTLAAGEHAESVVSIFGSSTSAGEAVTVVSIFGDTKVTGSAEDAAVAVFGNTTIDGKVDGDAVAVLGNVELGPHAEIGGSVVSVFGIVRRDPAAIVHGGVQNIFGADFGAFYGLRTWITHCLLYGRPLGLVSGLAWAWGLALGFLAFYVCLALLCRPAIDRCVQTFERQPGQTLLAAIVAMLLWPVLLVLLCVTVIGIAAVPFVMAAIVCAVLFGKAVMLAWIGGRITGPAAPQFGHPAFAVLVGGAVVLALYVVPVLGFLVYNLLGILGFGAVVYTLILAGRARQAAKVEPARAGVSPASIDATARSSIAPPSAEPEPAASEQPQTAASAAPAAPPPATASMPRAGFWIRMAALLIDILLVGFAMSVLHHVVHLHLLVLAAYGAVMWKLRGSTVGGIVFDLKVVRLDGRAVDWETAIVRALGCFLSLAVAGLGFIWIAFDGANQAWHDKIAGTVVVRVPSHR
ncbi:MAG TPA: RDD family protein [Steroidobacteraceae bacterium]|nr:RDD family protein [Steroidobacteraceae bacterium]